MGTQQHSPPAPHAIGLRGDSGKQLRKDADHARLCGLPPCHRPAALQVQRQGAGPHARFVSL